MKSQRLPASILMVILVVLGLMGTYFIAPTVKTVASNEPIVVDGQGYDWKYENCFALSPPRDSYQFVDYYPDSRDIVAVYYAVGETSVYFRIDLLDLAYGVEAFGERNGTNVNDGLNIYVMVGWENAPGYQEWVPDFVSYGGKGVHLPDYHWVLAIAVYDTYSYKIYDYNWAAVVENQGLNISFNAQWDLVEVGVPASILVRYGWTPTTRVWARVATTIGLTNAHLLADGVPHAQLTQSAPDRVEWPGALFTDARCPTVKLALVHHANQHLFDNRALNDPFSRNSYGFVLWVHEDVSMLANRPIPVGIHMSGTLLASYVWYDPGFVNYIRNLIGKRVVYVVGGFWAEYIPAYFFGNFNEPSMDIAKKYYFEVLGYQPVTAWIPERTWDDERVPLASSVSKYYKAVILDEITHHHDWSPDTNALKPHKYTTSRTEGRNLYVFFIHWETQQKLLGLTDGGLNIDLRVFYIQKALDWDQQQLILYADDWEKASGIAGWPVDPSQYENAVRWIAQHPWIQVVSLDEVVEWLETGSWTPVDGYYCGYDTYIYIKQWVQDYPYDYRRAYDGWYWGTPREKSFARYGSGETQPNYKLPDTIMPFGDVFGYTSFNGLPSNTVIYRLFAPGGLFDQAPRNELWSLAVIVANSMLYETAWHEESDWDGDGLHDCPGWGLNQWNHLRHINVLLEAAKWLEKARYRLVNGVNYQQGDFDWDGRSELIVFSPTFFAWIDEKGGAIPLLVYYNSSKNRVSVVVGTLANGWGVLEDSWYNSNHLALFVDDYYTGTGANYYRQVFEIGNITASKSCIEVTLLAPDMDKDSIADYVKTITLCDSGGVLVEARYINLSKSGSIYVASGLTINYTHNLFYGYSYTINGEHAGTSTIQTGAPEMGIVVTMSPINGAEWTGPSDLQNHTLAIHLKNAVSAGGSVRLIIATPTIPTTTTPTETTETTTTTQTTLTSTTTQFTTTTTATTSETPTTTPSPSTTAMPTETTTAPPTATTTTQTPPSATTPVITTEFVTTTTPTTATTWTSTVLTSQPATTTETTTSTTTETTVTTSVTTVFQTTTTSSHPIITTPPRTETTIITSLTSETGATTSIPETVTAPTSSSPELTGVTSVPITSSSPVSEVDQTTLSQSPSSKEEVWKVDWVIVALVGTAVIIVVFLGAQRIRKRT